MIALSIIAGGVLAIAAVLFVRPSPRLYTADQRGITLQTLIVTAVLVLMAVAAGVVIVAITNSAQSDLESQQSDLGSRCERWEIFDQTLAAAGRGNGNGGIDSSAQGCLRVCYVSYQLGTADATADITSTETDLVDKKNADLTNDESVLRFSRSDITKIQTTDVAKPHILPVRGDRAVDKDGNGSGTDTIGIGKIKGSTSVDNFEIRVATNQRYCQVWNTTTDREEFRSKS